MDTKILSKLLKKLDLKYLDVYLIHWLDQKSRRHNWQETNAGSWKAFEELMKQNESDPSE
jgi:diketogulonate reductase-like aldo/keto reductase